MTMDDAGQNDPSGLQVSGHGELLAGELLGQPQDREPELDANRLPARAQPARGRMSTRAISRLIGIACPVLGAVSVAIAITYVVSHHKLAGHLVGLAKAASWPAWIGVFPFLGLSARWIEGNKHKEAIISIVVVGGMLGLIGLWMLTGGPPSGV
jgi:hypothetical protein